MTPLDLSGLETFKLAGLSVLEIASLAGTFVFAASGAMVGVQKRFDLLGVIVLGCVTAVGGGSLRDSLTGNVPPIWFKDERYLWTAIIGAIIGFIAYRRLERRVKELEWLDALGLALFAATGAQKGLEQGFGPLGVIFVGTLSGVGGGVIRDVLAKEVPRIFLPGELYASTAALGCLAVIISSRLIPNSSEIALLIGASVTLFTRLASRRYKLTLPARDPNKPLFEDQVQ
jgi:uncharacterized membrane protein YeiH